MLANRSMALCQPLMPHHAHSPWTRLWPRRAHQPPLDVSSVDDGAFSPMASSRGVPSSLQLLHPASPRYHEKRGDLTLHAGAGREPTVTTRQDVMDDVWFHVFLTDSLLPDRESIMTISFTPRLPEDLNLPPRDEENLLTSPRFR